MNMKTYINSIKIAICLFILNGCIGYSLQPTLPDGIKSVAIKPIINKTSEPAIEIKVQEALAEFIQLDGRLELTNQSEADAIIEITLTRYVNNPIAYKSNTREFSPKTYLQGVHATALLRNNTTGEIISKTINHGESVFDFEFDISNSKRNVFSNAADELVRMIYTDLIEQW